MGTQMLRCSIRFAQDKAQHDSGQGSPSPLINACVLNMTIPYFFEIE
jgi:hypothetical protein